MRSGLPGMLDTQRLLDDLCRLHRPCRNDGDDADDLHALHGADLRPGCPADAIKMNEDGVVMSALKPRCLDCRNCVNACPFGVPKYNSEMHLQMKCDMCYDRTSEGLKPMCASVCPTGALAFGTYEQIVPLRRTKPVNVHVFGNQRSRRRFT